MSVEKIGQGVDAESHDYHTRRLSRRTAEVAAAFFLPHLRPGMRVLDGGCGPGTITVGLAHAVAPGEVVGIDPLANRLDLARSTAASQGVKNVRFELGDLYNLPFEDGAFDAAFVHAVMEHVTNPVGALAEVRRVLKPGGVIGVRSSTHAAALQWPNPELAQANASIWTRQKHAEGANWSVAPSLRGLLHAAGFSRVIGSASLETYGTPEETQMVSQEVVDILGTNPMIQDAIANGFTDADEIERLRAGWGAWGEHSDAFLAITWCEAIGWTD